MMSPRGTLGHQLTLVQDYQVIRIPAGVVQVAEQFKQADLVRQVQVGGGLVQQQQLRVLRQHHGYSDALALAAGEFIDPLAMRRLSEDWGYFGFWRR